MQHRKYAILGDIHSNWEALTAVLADADAQGVNEYVCVGDVVGYNADPVACLEKVKSLDCVTVQGNHDHYCSNTVQLNDFHPLAARVVEWTRAQLSDEQVEWLRRLPLVEKVAGFTVVHSTLDMPEKWGYVFDTIEADAHFNYQSTAVCFYGHTHLPVVFELHKRAERKTYHHLRVDIGARYFINTGSVGQPRDGDPRASYAIYDLRSKEIELRRIPYDIEGAQAKIHKARLPERLATRLALGK